MGIVDMMESYAKEMADDHEIEEAAGVWKAAEWLSEHWTEIIREVLEMDLNDPRMVEATTNWNPSGLVAEGEPWVALGDAINTSIGRGDP